MAASFSEALAAYRQAALQAQPRGGAETAQMPTGTNAPTPTDDAGQSFKEVLGTAAQDAVKTIGQGEKQSLEAAAGSADMNDVVMAMSKAEMTLQSVTAVRDKAIQAYQQIIKMPI